MTTATVESETVTTATAEWKGDDAISFLRLVPAVGVAAGKNKERPILTGVLLDTDGIVATDSYRLAYVKFDTQLPAPVILSPENVTWLGKLLTKKIVLSSQSQWLLGVTVDYQRNTVEWSWTDPAGYVTGSTFPSIYGTFPQYRQLLPKGSEILGHQKIGFNAALLAGLAATQKAAFVDPAQAPVQFVGVDNAEGSISVGGTYWKWCARDLPEFQYVLMSVRLAS